MRGPRAGSPRGVLVQASIVIDARLPGSDYSGLGYFRSSAAPTEFDYEASGLKGLSLGGLQLLQGR